MEFVARTVLEKSLTFHPKTIEENLQILQDYTTQDYYEFLMLGYIATAFPEYAPAESLDELPQHLRDGKEFKRWLQENGVASSAVVLSVRLTRCTDPNNGEAVVKVVRATRTKDGYLSQAIQTFRVFLVHEEDNPVGSYWVVSGTDILLDSEGEEQD
ncbi:MAG: hypothetical protein ACUVT4_06180 [Actinomycetota bacterium]